MTKSTSIQFQLREHKKNKIPSHKESGERARKGNATLSLATKMVENL